MLFDPRIADPRIAHLYNALERAARERPCPPVTPLTPEELDRLDAEFDAELDALYAGRTEAELAEMLPDPRGPAPLHNEPVRWSAPAWEEGTFLFYDEEGDLVVETSAGTRITLPQRSEDVKVELRCPVCGGWASVGDILDEGRHAVWCPDDRMIVKRASAA